MPRRLASALVLIAAIALAGCGLQPKKGSSGIHVTVTKDFGTDALGAFSEASVPSGQTLSALLRRFVHVVAGSTAGSVAAINGVAAGTGGAQTSWGYYVNGVSVPPGTKDKYDRVITPENTSVHAGDRLWWDFHDSDQSAAVPAVVGSFPEPFVHGIGGQRYPTTLECASDLQSACNAISNQLTKDGVPVADQALGTGSGQDTLALVVATWPELRGSLAGYLISSGPKHSGVYARFTGNVLQLLNPRGAVVRQLGPGAGLVAATNDSVNQPEWLVTGVDAAGVRAAAAALTPAKLANHFAVAVQGTTVIPVPLDTGS